MWASVGIGVSVHALSCFGLATHGTADQRQRWLPRMLGGELLGAYSLSEAHAGYAQQRHTFGRRIIDHQGLGACHRSGGADGGTRPDGGPDAP